MKLVKLFPLACLLLLWCKNAIAQKQIDNWFFPSNLGISFSSGSPAANTSTDASTQHTGPKSAKIERYDLPGQVNNETVSFPSFLSIDHGERNVQQSTINFQLIEH